MSYILSLRIFRLYSKIVFINEKKDGGKKKSFWVINSLWEYFVLNILRLFGKFKCIIGRMVRFIGYSKIIIKL